MGACTSMEKQVDVSPGIFGKKRKAEVVHIYLVLENI